MRVAVVYPHQFFADHPACLGAERVYVVEDPLFFRQYDFHRQKLILHRASMKRFAVAQENRGRRVRYVEAGELEDSAALVPILKRDGVSAVARVDPCDDWLGSRIAAALRRAGIADDLLDNPWFLTPRPLIDELTAGGRGVSFADFYAGQRRRLGLLIDGGRPVGGRWSFDGDNRKSLPRGMTPPPISRPPSHPAVAEAREYVRRNFPNAPGDHADFGYPTDPGEARAASAEFVRDRLPAFGDYEDAISRSHTVLFHSLLGPPLNAGLISPADVIAAAVEASDSVPLNALEGFVRQVVGWREYVRLTYLTRGRRQRVGNFWGHACPMPAALYDGTTGIAPVDAVVGRVLRTGYCHHIERLMVLGNFMMLCEIHPDAVYRWFMELFTDAYDWVMVPNVYGMSQFADGGAMMTKPYMSGSAYILKMSDFPRGPWCRTWDALYWRFVDRHAEVFAANPRTAAAALGLDRLGAKLSEHRRVADEFLDQLHGGRAPASKGLWD